MTLWTLREVAAWRGLHIGTVRALAGRADGWPEPVGRRANAFTYTAESVKRWFADRELRDDQWSMARVAKEFGVTLSLVRSARRRGSLPAPDGMVEGRPWWLPDTAHRWWQARQVPLGVWTRSDIEGHTGMRVYRRSQVPPADGEALGVAWWHPDTVRDWWSGVLAVRALADQRRAEKEQVRLKSGHPDRWYAKDVAANTGLSYESVRTYRKLGKLPEPDGMERHRPWWYPGTIRAWDRPMKLGRPRLSGLGAPSGE